MVLRLFRKKIPEDRDALIKMAAETLPWKKNSGGNIYVDLGQIDKHTELFRAAVDKNLLELTSARGVGGGQFMTAAHSDMLEAVWAAHPEFNRPEKSADTLPSDQNAPTGAELIKKGDAKKGRNDLG